MTSLSEGIPIDYVVVTTVVIKGEGEALGTISDLHMNPLMLELEGTMEIIQLCSVFLYRSRSRGEGEVERSMTCSS